MITDYSKNHVVKSGVYHNLYIRWIKSVSAKVQCTIRSCVPSGV